MGSLNLATEQQTTIHGSVCVFFLMNQDAKRMSACFQHSVKLTFFAKLIITELSSFHLQNSLARRLSGGYSPRNPDPGSNSCLLCLQMRL